MKKFLPLIIITLISFSCAVKAQDFVNFHGDTEKALLTLASTPDDLLKLAFTSELNGDEYVVLYNKFLQDLKQLNLESAVGDKSGKHLKKIYEIVHDRFLKTYNPQAHFGDFAVNGEYECSSASILYAYILEKLNVPYQIIQLPAHTYVVANPGTDNIKFETIDPSKGFFVFSDESKQKDVADLIKTGYMEQSYVIRVGVERAFDDFFYDKSELSLKEAVGLLYFKKALFEMGVNSTEAYSDIYKSDMLFPDKKNEYFKNELMGEMVAGFKFDDIKDWKGLVQVVNSRMATDETRKYIQFKFEDFLNTKLINGGQKDKVNEVYNYLRANVADTAVKKHLAEDYFFQTAQYAYLTNDYTQALNCLETAYSINPNNPLIVSNFVQMILHKYAAATPNAQNLDVFDKYINSYPSLKNNLVIVSLDEYYMAMICINGFVSGDGVKGEKYIQLLTHQLDAHPDEDNKFHQPISSAFASASVYYWRKQQKQKAIAVLNQGLKYEPNSEELQRKLRADTGQ